MANRARPDLLIAMSFLTTRVKHPTFEDKKKLAKVLKYMDDNKDLCLRLSADKGMVVTAHIDGTHHADGKDHTRNIMLLDKGAVFASL